MRSRVDMVGLDSSVILPRSVWEAFGHVATFMDPLVECLSCHRRQRQDHLIEAFEAKKGRAPENMGDRRRFKRYGSRYGWWDGAKKGGLGLSSNQGLPSL